MNIEQGISNVEVNTTTMEQKRKFDLEDRLVAFAVLIIEIAESLHNTKAGNHLSGQLVRSGTSPALHYGEAQSAESRADFIHKIKVLLKELRETRSALLIIRKAGLTDNIGKVEKALIECNELISIFVKSLETAKRNLQLEKKNKSVQKNEE
jgi:four helix bundle protein